MWHVIRITPWGHPWPYMATQNPWGHLQTHKVIRDPQDHLWPLSPFPPQAICDPPRQPMTPEVTQGLMRPPQATCVLPQQDGRCRKDFVFSISNLIFFSLAFLLLTAVYLNLEICQCSYCVLRAHSFNLKRKLLKLNQGNGLYVCLNIFKTSKIQEGPLQLFLRRRKYQQIWSINR
jgi:hypothetical protein